VSDLIMPKATRTDAHSQSVFHPFGTAAGEVGYFETFFTYLSEIVLVTDVVRVLAIHNPESEES